MITAGSAEVSGRARCFCCFIPVLSFGDELAGQVTVGAGHGVAHTQGHIPAAVHRGKATASA